MEADLVQRKKVPFTSIPAAGVHGVGLRALPGNLLRLAQGTLAARRIIRRFQPDVMLFTGGYVAVPAALAGRRIPSVLFVPDIEPGLALKTLARFATRIAVSVPDTRDFFRNDPRVVVSGYPTRPELQPQPQTAARRHFGLDPDQPVVGFFGGSSGARSINRAVLAALPELLEFTQVLHVTGKLDWDEVSAARSQLPEAAAARYAAYPYLHEEMALALSAPDLAVSRAGASALGEFPLFGLPAVLVPYPYAWRYQRVNAAYLVERNAALILEDARLTEDLLATVRTLLIDPDRLESMRQAMRTLACPQAAERLAGLVRELSTAHPEKRTQSSW